MKNEANEERQSAANHRRRLLSTICIQLYERVNHLNAAIYCIVPTIVIFKKGRSIVSLERMSNPTAPGQPSFPFNSVLLARSPTESPSGKNVRMQYSFPRLKFEDSMGMGVDEDEVCLLYKNRLEGLDQSLHYTLFN